MTWRYQPVWQENLGERFYSLCEVYLDADGKLESWTEDCVIAPVGDNMDDLRQTITYMQVEASRWKPVKFEDLAVGMSFERED